jgi:transposase
VIFADIDSPISLSFISEFPTPASADLLGEERMAEFMKSNAYCGRRSAVELLARLRAAPSGLAGPTEAQASGEMVSAQIRVLSPLVTAIARLTARIEGTVAELPDGKIIMSFPRAGQICAAQILVEKGDVRERYPSEDQLAAEAGVCPVTHASGKTRGVVFRRACNKNLRAAITALPTTPATLPCGQQKSTETLKLEAASMPTPCAS